MNPDNKTDAPVCARCGGQGYVFTDAGACECACTARPRLERKLEAAGVPWRRTDVPISEVEPASPDQTAAVERLREYARRFGPDTERGLYLCGPVGSGKSHLAKAVVAEIAGARGGRAPAEILWRSVSRLLVEAQAGMVPGAGGAGAPVLRACEVALLALDDLGAGRATEWGVEQVALIVDERDSRGRPTVLTGNLPLFTPAGRTAGETVESVFGKRVASRLWQMCEVVPVLGLDLRRGRAGGGGVQR